MSAQGVVAHATQAAQPRDAHVAALRSDVGSGGQVLGGAVVKARRACGGVGLLVPRHSAR